MTPSLVSASVQKARQASFCLSAIPPLSPSGLSLPVPIPSRLDSDPSSLAPTVFLGGLTCSKFHPPPWRARLPHLHRPLSPLSSRSAKATFLHSTALSWLPSRHLHLTISTAAPPSPPVHSGLAEDVTSYPGVILDFSHCSHSQITAKYYWFKLLNISWVCFPPLYPYIISLTESPQESPSSSPTSKRPTRVIDLAYTPVTPLLNTLQYLPITRFPNTKLAA